jgi:galactokinase
MLTLSQLKKRISEDDWYARQFGADAPVMDTKKSLARSVLETFTRSFSTSERTEVAAYFVPGRVEALGKHTDYAGGHSLLIAADRGFFCLSALNGTPRVRMVENDPSFPSCEFEISPNLDPPVGHWSNYPMTMVKRLAADFTNPPDRAGRDAPPLPITHHSSLTTQHLQGVDVAFGCDLPVASGMSGSSALMIMTFFALALPNRLMESKRFQRNVRSGVDLAMYLACAENGQTFRELEGGAGVGTFGGSEDHTQILNAKAGTFSVYQFCPTTHKADIVFPDDLAMVIAYSGVHAEKTGAAMEDYNLAARRARLVVERYNERYSASSHLLRDIVDEGKSKDVMLAQVESATRGVSEGGRDLDLFGRFLQFYREDREVIPDAVRALILRDDATLGEVIDRSHGLSREYLWNIAPEIDCLQQTARELGAIAASGFGAGFGGSAYAIVRKGAEAEFAREWSDNYRRRFPQRANDCQFFTVTASAKAAEMFAS